MQGPIAAAWNLLSPQPEYLAPVIVGAIFGALFVLNGWAEKPPPKGSVTVLGSAFRVKNMIYVFGGSGAAAASLGNWKMIFGKDINNGIFFLYYLGSAFVFALIIGSIVMIVIGFDALFRGVGSKIPALLLEYTHYGYNSYVIMRDQFKSVQDQAREAALRRAARLERHAEVQRAFAGVIHSTKSDIPVSDKISEALRVISLAVRNLAETPEGLVLRSNFMRYVKSENAPTGLPNSALFTFGERARYSGYLVLDRPGGQVVLPVEKTGSIRFALPGAPDAFATDRTVIVDVKKMKSRKEVPKATKDAIRAYFAGEEFANCRSLTSIAIPAGVVNIESNRHHLVGEGEDAGMQIAMALRPYTAVLSAISA